MSFFEDIDVFDNTKDDDYYIMTKGGIIMSFILLFFGIILFTANFFNYIQPSVERTLNTKKSLISGMEVVNISLSIYLSSPCDLLNLDLHDMLGNHILASDKVTFRRSLPNKTIVGYTKRAHLDNCFSCYEVNASCCNSCRELILLYRLLNLEPTPQNWSQCEKEDYTLYKDENCLMKGKLAVNKVSGNFRITIGHNLYKSFYSIHTIIPSNGYNLSHAIPRFRFGPKIPTLSMPLEGSIVIEKQSEPKRYFYNLLLTPIIFMNNDKITSKTFEYSSFMTTFPVDWYSSVPEINFQYSFTPYSVIVLSNQKPLIQFVTTTFGTLAGAFALLGIVQKMFIQSVE